MIVHFDALELEVALPRVTPLVVLRQGVKLLGVEVADCAQVQGVEDHVWVVGVDVLLKCVEVLRGEGAVFALVAPLLPARRLGQVWWLGGEFVRICGGVRFCTRLRLCGKVHFDGVLLSMVVGYCLVDKEGLNLKKKRHFPFKSINHPRNKSVFIISFSWDANPSTHFHTRDEIFQYHWLGYCTSSGKCALTLSRVATYMQDELATKSNLITKSYIDARHRYYSHLARTVAKLMTGAAWFKRHRLVFSPPCREIHPSRRPAPPWPGPVGSYMAWRPSVGWT